jgi:hypothetical protein
VAFAGNSFIACKDDPGICPGPGWQPLSTNKLEPGPLILTSNDVASASFSPDVAPTEREHSPSFGRAPWDIEQRPSKQKNRSPGHCRRAPHRTEIAATLILVMVASLVCSAS